MSGREEGREEGREQAELRRVGRAAAELRWLKRLVQDLNQVLDTAAADIDADISLLQELGACGKRFVAEEIHTCNEYCLRPVINKTTKQPVMDEFGKPKTRCRFDRPEVKYLVKYMNKPATLGQFYVTKSRVTTQLEPRDGTCWSTMEDHGAAGATR